MNLTQETSEAPDGFDQLREEVLAIYQELDREIASRGPVCQLSGRCCRFAEYDHTLFLSQIELEVLLADAPPPSRPLDEGLTCPWQDPQGHCTARNARPLGCRVYYCDPNYEGQATEISEEYLARLKQLTLELEQPWNYAPLHRHLANAWPQIDR